MKRLFLLHFLLILFLTVNTDSVFASIQPLEDIRQTAIDFARHQISHSGSDISITASHLDKRLRLPLCERPLEAFSPHHMKIVGNTTIGVRCNGDKSWSIYVPVLIHIYQKVAVADRSLPRKRILTQADLRFERMDISRYSGAYITDPKQLIGKQLTRPVQIGQPFIMHMLKAPISVRRGDKVQLLTKSKSFQISVQGEALMDGAIGDTIQVRNIRSKRIIQGRLLGNGTVFVN